MKTFALSLVAALGLLAGGSALAAVSQDKAPAAEAQAPAADQAVIDAQLPSYPLADCPISGEKLDGEAKNVVVEGRLIRVCCGRCAKKVQTDPKEALAEIDAGVIAQQKSRYPLSTCPISGEALGAEAKDVVVGTKLVRTCCGQCAGKVQKSPREAMAKVDAGWIEAGKKSYPLDTCVVSGEKLGSMGEPVDYLYGTRLVRLCCKGCVKQVTKDAAPLLAKIDAATKTR